MQPAILTERKPRFQRSPTSDVLLTERDVDAIAHVARHRFLRSSHLTVLLAASPQVALRRLNLLFHHGYLDRPRVQLDYYLRGGSQPLVYALGNRGAQVLAERRGAARGKINWAAKNQNVTRVFLNHNLFVADVMVALEVATRRSGSVRLLQPEDLLPQFPEETRRRRNPFSWSVPLPERAVMLGVIPDKIFGLEFADAPKGRNRAYFFLEADTGTMPVVRQGFDRTSVFRKLVAYFETWQQKLHTAHFGFKNFRVLAVTNSAERVAHLVEANRMVHPEGSRVFLFADLPALTAGDPLRFPWTNGKGEQTLLTE